MYGIGNRPLFHTYVPNTKGTKSGSTYFFNSNEMKRYYSSLDVELYFGNYYIDEITQIQFGVRQSVMPLFGFNSYTFDEVAIGSRIVQGVFAVNFTSPGYLVNLLEELKRDIVVGDNVSNVSKDDEGAEGDNVGSVFGPGRIGRGPLWDTAFDIDIMYGQDTEKSKATHIILEGVVITDFQQEMGLTGQPIQEFYSFIAKDIRYVD